MYGTTVDSYHINILILYSVFQSYETHTWLTAAELLLLFQSHAGINYGAL